MRLEEVYKICKKSEVSEDECSHVIKAYIKLRKNKEVQVKPPYADLTENNLFTKGDYVRRIQLMNKMYSTASMFIILLHENPEQIKVKVYK